MRMLKKVDTTWSSALAYVVGMIATDGCLSSDRRHINITSKDEDLLISIRNALALTCKIGKKSRGGSKEKKYSVLSIGDKNFFNFLMDLGLHPNKSKTMGQLAIPKKWFADFLRGCIDGDGSITISSHPETKLKQLRLRLASASPRFLSWITEEIKKQVPVRGGWIYTAPNESDHNLSFAKSDSVKIFHFMYDHRPSLYLERKFKRAEIFMGK